MIGKFKVIKIDPEGSGMDYSGHLGFVFDGQRCCENCTIIFGTDENFGPFVIGELEPLDYEAIEIMWDVLAHREEQRIRARRPGATIVYARSFQKALAELKGEVYFDAPLFEIKKGNA